MPDRGLGLPAPLQTPVPASTGIGVRQHWDLMDHEDTWPVLILRVIRH
jgi:hypothetical protein